LKFGTKSISCGFQHYQTVFPLHTDLLSLSSIKKANDQSRSGGVNIVPGLFSGPLMNRLLDGWDLSAIATLASGTTFKH